MTASEEAGAIPRASARAIGLGSGCAARPLAASLIGHRQDLLPPPHHPIGFGKKTVTAEIHSIAAVVDRLGNAAHLAIGLDDDWRDIGPPQEFEGAVRPAGPRRLSLQLSASCRWRHGDVFRRGPRQTRL